MKNLTSNMVLLGATGLVGHQVLSLSQNPLICLSRRPIDSDQITHENLVSSSLLDIEWPEQVETVICCLGTTIKSAGNKSSFIDQELKLPSVLFEKALSKGAKRLFLVSALGANSQSRIFYNQVKGQLEETVIKQGWQQTVIFRPSLLIGKREQNRRGEQFAQLVTTKIAGIIPATVRPIQATELAKCILRAVEQPIVNSHSIIEGKKLWNQ